MLAAQQLWQDSVEQHHLAGQVHDIFRVGVRAPIIVLLQRVVRNLPQVRHSRVPLRLFVHETRCGRGRGKWVSLRRTNACIITGIKQLTGRLGLGRRFRDCALLLLESFLLLPLVQLLFELVIIGGVRQCVDVAFASTASATSGRRVVLVIGEQAKVGDGRVAASPPSRPLAWGRLLRLGCLTRGGCLSRKKVSQFAAAR